MPRKDVSFKTLDNVTLRGWLYTPSNPASGKKLPCLIMIHGWACLKEMDLPLFAEAFVASLPICVLIYDHRGFGSSDTRPGAPVREIVPSEQVSDFSDAVTYVQTLEEVDPESVGAWGYSYAGGHVIVAAAADQRIKCVMSIAPVVSGTGQFRRLLRADHAEGAFKAFEADRQARLKGEGEVARGPVVTADPMGRASLAAADAYAWFSPWEKKCGWVNDLTARSSYMGFTHEAMGFIQYISPRPLLMVVMDKDHNAFSDLALEAYEKARQPKQLQVLRGGHFDLFQGERFDKTKNVQVDFLRDWVEG